MLAVSLDNLLFLLLIGIAALFQLLSTALKKGNKNESQNRPKSPAPQASPPIRRAPPESDADRIRKFLEALGQPAGSSPPPPIVPRSGIPPRPLAPVQPPATQFPRAWRIPREQQQKPDVAPTPPPLKQIIPPPVPAPAAPTYEVHESLRGDLREPPILEVAVESYAAPKAFGIAKVADFKTDIAVLLRSKSSLRGAIILREILGPPRGLDFQAGVLE